MYTPACYMLHCQTNLHAGSGDTNYGIIDKMIQRDAITELPCIYASSLKGALREYFEEGPQKGTLNALADSIFGKKINTESDSNENSKGNTIFHEAQLIGFPMRSNLMPYFIATSKIALNNFLNKAMLFGLRFNNLQNEVNDLPDVQEDAPKVLRVPMNDLIVEDFENVGSQNAPSSELRKLLGENIILVHDKDFKEACSDYNLPVIARNNLENGESKNLWYEQIVPHQTRFIFFTVSLGPDQFSTEINDKAVQIGANSSLGYGYCKITKI